ncbi:MAG: PrsW family intramembrane metalloprotease [Chloroflexota bacterium]|nr:PrsW family intramembrane metalloprotease [Chloroflexota bacterium]
MSSSPVVAPNYAGGAVSPPPYLATLVIQGPAWRSRFAHGNQVPLFRPETHIGKLATNDIMVTDPYASRIHAVIRWSPQGYVIEDLRSTNGTYLNGQRLTAPTLLQPGQTIRIGQTQLTFYALQGQGTPAPAYAPPAYAPPVAAPAPFQHVDRALPSGQGIGGWLGLEWRKHYWKALLVGLVLLFIAEGLLNGGLGDAALIFVIPLAAALMPVTFFIYCWDSDYLSDMPRWIPWGAFISGAVLGVALAFVLEMIFVNGDSLGAAFVIGLIEESCKAAAVVFFLLSRKLRSEIDGVILGAAAGAGFATLETMLYATSAYFNAFHDGGGVAAVNSTLLWRGLLAIFGHVTWTAIVVGAVWRDRGQRRFRLTFGVILAFAIAVTLHALWDGIPIFGMLIAAVIGLWLMRFFLREAVAREKFGGYAPPPPPLALALITYLFHPFRSPIPRPAGPPAGTFSGSWRIAGPVGAPQPAYAAPPQPLPQPPYAPPPQPQARRCANGHITTDPQARFCRICGAPL